MVSLRHKAGRNQDGQAAVELALVLPLLVLLLFGMLEGGRILGTYLSVNHAVREGARLAALGATDAMIDQRVRDSAAMVDRGLLTVEINPVGQRQRGAGVTVSAAYPLPIFAPVIPALTGGTFTISASATMRVE